MNARLPHLALPTAALRDQPPPPSTSARSKKKHPRVSSRQKKTQPAVSDCGCPTRGSTYADPKSTTATQARRPTSRVKTYSDSEMGEEETPKIELGDVMILEQTTEESPTKSSPKRSSRNVNRRPSSLDMNDLGKYLNVRELRKSPSGVRINSLERIQFSRKVNESSTRLRSLQHSYSEMKSFIDSTFQENQQKLKNVDRYLQELRDLSRRPLYSQRKSRRPRDSSASSSSHRLSVLDPNSRSSLLQPRIEEPFSGSGRRSSFLPSERATTPTPLNPPKTDNQVALSCSESEGGLFLQPIQEKVDSNSPYVTRMSRPLIPKVEVLRFSRSDTNLLGTEEGQMLKTSYLAYISPELECESRSQLEKHLEIEIEDSVGGQLDPEAAEEEELAFQRIEPPPPPDPSPKPYIKMQQQLLELAGRLPEYFSSSTCRSEGVGGGGGPAELTPLHDLLEVLSESAVSSHLQSGLLSRRGKHTPETLEAHKRQLEQLEQEKRSPNKPFNVKDWVAESRRKYENEQMRRPLHMKQKTIMFDEGLPQLSHSSTVEALPQTAYSRFIKRRMERPRKDVASIGDNPHRSTSPFELFGAQFEHLPLESPEVRKLLFRQFEPVFLAEEDEYEDDPDSPPRIRLRKPLRSISPRQLSLECSIPLPEQPKWRFAEKHSKLRMKKRVQVKAKPPSGSGSEEVMSKIEDNLKQEIRKYLEFKADLARSEQSTPKYEPTKSQPSLFARKGSDLPDIERAPPQQSFRALQLVTRPKSSICMAVQPVPEEKLRRVAAPRMRESQKVLKVKRRPDEVPIEIVQYPPIHLNRNVTPIQNKTPLGRRLDLSFNGVAGTTKHLHRLDDARSKQLLQRKNLQLHLRDRASLEALTGMRKSGSAVGGIGNGISGAVVGASGGGGF